MLAFTGLLGSLMHIVRDHPVVVKKCCRQQVSDAEDTLKVQKIAFQSAIF